MYALYAFIFIIFNIFPIIFADANEPIKVNTNLGPIIGHRKTVENKEINEFLGVPYAQPPVKNLRFKKPLPVKSWKDPLNALSWPNRCFQRSYGDDMLYLNKNMSEDCLYLSIITPKPNLGHLKPVMVWIHGGALLAGAAGHDLYVPDLLVARGDIIIVSINYRLSTMGFLYTGTKDAPGNVGYYDQVMALKWVKDNIESFGGDPQQITIFGQSAGSWSVSVHVLSPLSRNLYKNAIMMSAAALTHHAAENPDIAVKGWVKGAKIAGCGNGDNFTTEAIDCLMKMDPKKLVLIPEYKELVSEPMWFIPLGIYGDELLPKSPIKMLESGEFKKNFTLFAGTTNDEGSFMLVSYDPKRFGHNSTINMTYNEAYDYLKQLSGALKSKIKVNSDDVAKAYFKEIPRNDENLLLNAIGRALGDFYILCPTIQFAKGIFKGDHQSRVYQYYFTRKQPTNGIFGAFCSKWQGTCHGTDLIDWFGYPFRHKQLFTDDDRTSSTNMMNLLIHFAKNGSPSPQNGIGWPNYYAINNEIVAPYYEFSRNPNPNGNFGKNLMHVFCDVLWKQYIGNQ